MKTKFLGAALLTGSLSLFACSSSDTTTTDATVLPDNATATIDANYPDATVTQIKVDKDNSSIDEYKVLLSNGTKVKFDQTGAVKELKAAANDSVPASLIPQEISNYVAANYPEQTIVEIDFGKKDTEVKLSSGVELKFDLQGNFIKVD